VSAADVIEISRALGRVEQHLIQQDQCLAQLASDVAQLRAKMDSDIADLKDRPTRRAIAFGRWAGGIVATIIAGIGVLFLRRK
jgi:hypothetical protein